jgi:hypothetical protein
LKVDVTGWVIMEKAVTLMEVCPLLI